MSALDCPHGNEVPSHCLCSADCHCKTHSCRPYIAVPTPDPGSNTETYFSVEVNQCPYCGVVSSQVFTEKPKENVSLYERAEIAVARQHGFSSVSAFRIVRERRHKVHIDDWSGEIQMVLRALEDLERYHAKTLQGKLPGTE